MTDGIMLQVSDDGKATLYESTYDITIHCDSEKEQHEVMERLKLHELDTGQREVAGRR